MTEVQTENIYDPGFVRRLFDEMSATYGITNYISSFGFCQRWRQQCVALASIRPGMTVYDLMSGMGECWHLINRFLRDDGQILALDFSPEMCRRAAARKRRLGDLAVEVMEEDFLANSLPSAAADRVVSAFGLKTFSDPQMAVAAAEIARILKPGGVFSLVEISVPPATLLRLPYLFYLRRIIPLIGRLFLGNPDNYRLLGVYTEAFRNTSEMGRHLAAAGLEVEHRSFFFGCATGLRGRQPEV